MAKQKGSDMLLKLDTTGSGNYTTIGGIQGQRVNSRRGDAEVTNQGSPSKHRELLEGAGIFSQSISGNGVLDSAAPTPTLHSVFMAGTIRNWQVIVPGLGTYQGLYQITQFEVQGPHDKEATYSISLESAGQITFTAA